VDIAGLAVPIDASGAVRGRDEFNRALDSMSNKADTAAQRIRSQISGITGSFFNLRNAILGLGFGRLTEGIVDANTQMQRISNTLLAAKGSAGLAAVTFGELRDLAYRLGLDLPTVAQQFAQMSAAAKGTALEGAGVEKSFRAVVTASTALGLSSQHTELALYAIQQMISKGAVTMQELRRQLGDNLPGAFNVAAQAMGVTTSKLTEMVRSGQLLTSQFLPKFSELLEKRYAAAAEKAAGSTQALLNKFKTALFEFRLFISEGGFGEAFNSSLRKVTDLLRSDEMKDAARNFGSLLAKAISLATDAFAFLAKHANEVLFVLGAFATLRTGLFFAELTERVIKLTKELKELQAVQALLSAGSLFSSSGSATAVAAGDPFSLFKTRGGKLLNTSQFRTRAASGAFEDVGEAEKQFKALSILYGRNGQLLSQQQLNTRLTSTAVKELDIEIKKLSESYAKQLGLQVSFNAASLLTVKGWQELGTSARLTITRLVSTPWATITGLVSRLGVAASGAAGSLMGVLASVPVWGWIAAAIAAAGIALYSFRDSVIEVNGHSAKLKTFGLTAWELIRDTIKDALKPLADFKNKALDAVKSVYSFVMDVYGTPMLDALKSGFSKFGDWLETTWVGQAKNALKEFFGAWAEYSENREKTDKAAMEGGFKNAFGQVQKPGILNVPDFALNFKPQKSPIEDIETKAHADRIKQTIQRLNEEKDSAQTLIKINKDYVSSLYEGNAALRDEEARRKALQQIIQLEAGGKRKLTDAQKEQILSLNDWVAKLRDLSTAYAKIRQESLNLSVGIEQTDKLTAATLQGETAVRRVNREMQIENAIRALGVDIKGKEVDVYKSLIDKYLKSQEALRNAEAYKSFLETYDAEYKYRRELERLNLAVPEAMRNTQAYKLALQDLQDAYDRQVDEMLSKSRNGRDGIVLFMREYVEQSKRSAQNIHDAFANAFQTLNDQFVQFLDKGKFSFGSFLDSLRHQLNQLIVQKVFSKLFESILGAAGPGSPDTGGGNFLTKIFRKVLGIFTGGKSGGGITPSTNPLAQPFVQAAVDVDNAFKAMIQEVGLEFKQMIAGLQGAAASGSGGGGGILGTIIGAAVGLFTGGAPSISGGSIPKLFGDIGPAPNLPLALPGFAMGGIMTNRGVLQLNQYRFGGVADSPQLAMFGELRRPEAYVPLPDGRTIPVTIAGGQSSRPPKVSVNVINQSGQQVDARRGQSRWDPTLEEMVVDVFLKQQTTNGPIRRSQG
jgi:lambda family phage tail tape measure protein